jgi:pimeloyl-ACP methyl ester carboxylesterase
VESNLEIAKQALEAYLRPPPAPRDFKSESLLLDSADQGSVLISPGVENPKEEIHYYSWGKGPRQILLIHGWGGKGTQYLALIPALLEAGFKVIACDAPAHGKSTGEFASGPAFARTVREVAALFGPLHGIIGHSLGCAGIVIAISQSLEPRKVVFLAPLAFAIPHLERFALRRGFGPEVTAELFRLFRARYTGEILSAPILAEKFECSALIFHDPEDPEVPIYHGEALASHWPGARLIRVPRAGHWSILRNKKVIETTIDFLEKSE